MRERGKRGTKGNVSSIIQVIHKQKKTDSLACLKITFINNTHIYALYSLDTIKSSLSLSKSTADFSLSFVNEIKLGRKAENKNRKWEKWSENVRDFWWVHIVCIFQEILFVNIISNFNKKCCVIKKIEVMKKF